MGCAWIVPFLLAAANPSAVHATAISPPMLDITRQCDAVSRHNATAMSECVVAESEARSELLQKWDKFSDTSVQKCVKIGRKARKLPYTAMAKCLAIEDVNIPPQPQPATPAEPTPAPKPKTEGILPSWLSYPLKH